METAMTIIRTATVALLWLACAVLLLGEPDTADWMTVFLLSKAGAAVCGWAAWALWRRWSSEGKAVDPLARINEMPRDDEE